MNVPPIPRHNGTNPPLWPAPSCLGGATVFIGDRYRSQRRIEIGRSTILQSTSSCVMYDQMPWVVYIWGGKG